MTGPIPTNQDIPLDPDAYRHQLLLLKSMHCARPVLYEGRNQFIKCLTANLSGSDVGMVVHLAGFKEGIDSSALQINTNSPRDEEKHA